MNENWQNYFKANEATPSMEDLPDGLYIFRKRGDYWAYRPANLSAKLPQAPGLYPQHPEGVTFKIIESPAIPDGVAVSRDKDGKEVGRITDIGD